VVASVFLKALTPEARAALGGPSVKIAQFPFRVGRESRTNSRSGAIPASPGRRAEAFPNNDLYLVETGNIFNVSREHFLIDAKDGHYILLDRGSSCGTLVEGDLVGERKQGGWRRLKDHDVIIVGTSDSKFIFKFIASETA
jgi:hypothetical protein